MIFITSFIGVLLTFLAISMVLSVIITVFITGAEFSEENFWVGLLAILLMYIIVTSFYITKYDFQKYEEEITVTVSENSIEK